MHDAWVETTLGEAAVVLMGQAPPGESYNIAGAGLPFLQGSAEFGEHSPTATKWCTAPTKIAEAGDLLLSVRAPVGATNFADQRTAIGRGLAAIRTDDAVKTRYLRLVLQSAAASLQARSGGGMFESITGANLRALPLSLPPLDVQRRIVDLASHIASVEKQLEQTETATRRLLGGLLLSERDGASGVRQEVSACCQKIIGGTWGADAGTAEIDLLALGPRIYSPGMKDFVTDGSPVRSYSQRQVSERLVRRGDILLERSGGSPEQPVGRVVIANGSEGPCMPTDFQRLLRPDPNKVLPSYLFWRLRGDWLAGETLNFSRRTTGITNLDVPSYLHRDILIPDLKSQEAFIDCCDAVDLALGAAREERQASGGAEATDDR